MKLPTFTFRVVFCREVIYISNLNTLGQMNIFLYKNPFLGPALLRMISKTYQRILSGYIMPNILVFTKFHQYWCNSSKVITLQNRQTIWNGPMSFLSIFKLVCIFCHCYFILNIVKRVIKIKHIFIKSINT